MNFLTTTSKAKQWFVTAAIFLSLQLTAIPDTSISKEYQLKAAFLFNFAAFTQWPSNAFSVGDAPLVIGVLGDDPFDGALDQTLHGEKIDGHPLTVKHYQQVGEIETCHILFICASESGQLHAILADLKARNVLTVGDMDDFAGHGGIIQLATKNNKIHLRINVDAAKAAHLTLSSKLLRPAEIVNGGD